MKKLVCIIFSVLVISGCNRAELQTKKEVAVKKTVITDAKEYYVGKVTYVNHDDFFEYSYKVKNDVQIVQVINNDVIEKSFEENEEREEIIDSIDMNEKDKEVIKNNNQNEEMISDSIVTNTDLEIKEEIIEEKKLTKEETVIDDLGPNIEFGDNNISEEKIEIETTEEVITEELEMPNEIKTGYYAPNGNYLGKAKVKVIDVSYYQGDINWDVFASESDCYGVILRLGYYDTLDKKFERNISELKRLNIPYGIYLFSYATTFNGSDKEALFTNEMIDKYELNPILGIYYDIESWVSSNGASSNDITKEEYDIIISNYINKVSSHVENRYKVKVYSGRWYAMNRLGAMAKSYVDWVAEYNSTLKYDSSYTMWQYTSKGSVPGINGNVDISYLY